MRRGVAAAAAATMAVVLGQAWVTSAVAGSGGGEPTESGYGAWAVEFTSDSDVSQDSLGRVARPAPKCWWTYVDAPDPHDAEGVYEWFQDYLSQFGPSSAGGGPYYVATSRYPQAFEDAIEDDQEEPGVTWYRLEAPGMSMQEVIDSGCTTTLSSSMIGEVPITFRAFPHNTPPAPVIDEEVLARYAYDVMDLVKPTLEWNPKIESRNNAALVNLPTWAWVANSDAVSTRSVTASVGNVSVTVVAEPADMTVASTGLATAVTCSADEATQAYSPSADESSACTVTFTRPSPNGSGGFDVITSVEWTASWTSNTGRSEGLPDRTITGNTPIRVAQSQALVTQVD